MKYIKRFVFIAVVIFAVYYLIMNPELIERDQTELEKKEMLLEKKQNYDESLSSSVDADLVAWIGKSTDDLNQSLGEPKREDLSAYGYTWYVYQEDHSEYKLFGIEDEEIVTVFATGDRTDLNDVHIGQSYDELDDELSFTNEITYQKGTSQYTFILKDEDVAARPLVKINNDLFLQFYFDTVTESLVAVRIISGEVLLLHQDYEIQYRGQLPTKEPLSTDEWEKVNHGHEQQVFELTNVVRNQYNHPTLSWEEDVSEVAFSHSKDMSDNEYFSHETLYGEGLTERLARYNINYRQAGENIAANYPDALAAVVGWLNSEGHRESLLNDQFTHLGVGVYELYYTQNFIQK